MYPVSNESVIVFKETKVLCTKPLKPLGISPFGLPSITNKVESQKSEIARKRKNNLDQKPTLNS